MNRRACVVLFVLLTGCSLKAQQGIHVGLQSADLGSTAVAESRGAIEANPLMRIGTVERIAVKALVTASVLLVTSKVAGEGHQAVARAMVLTLNAVLAGVVVNNFRVARCC